MTEEFEMNSLVIIGSFYRLQCKEGKSGSGLNYLKEDTTVIRAIY